MEKSAPSMEAGVVHSHLPGGMRLVSILRPNSPVIAIRLYVRAGSRYDVSLPGSDPANPPLGLAHITEHMLFKGSQHSSPKAIFQHIEQFGGVLNGGTAKEYSHFDVVIPPEGLSDALEVLAEVLIRPAFDEDQFWLEKLVLLEELRGAQDRQGMLIDGFAQALWQRNPLRNPATGTLPGLYALDYADLLAFYGQCYRGDATVLAVCGDLQPDRLHECVAQVFADYPAGDAQLEERETKEELSEMRRFHLSKDAQQVYMLLGVPTVGMDHPERSALKLVELLLGTGGSACLYQRLREERRLVYRVSALTAQYAETGYLAVSATCQPANVHQVVELTLAEWQRLADSGPGEAELQFVKGYYSGRLRHRFETCLALAGIYGVECLLGQFESLSSAIERINQVTTEQVRQAAARYLQPGCYVLATIGPDWEA
jgi:predicted Zn-dependent peptidase